MQQFCSYKDDCPLPGKCTSQNIVYQATVKSPNEEKIYIGLTSTTFKTRFSSHKNSFIHPEKRQTELSTHIWKLKDKKHHILSIGKLLSTPGHILPEQNDATSVHGKNIT